MCLWGIVNKICSQRCNTCQTYFGNVGSRNIYQLFSWGRNGVILVAELMIWFWLWMKVFIVPNGLWPELFKFIAVPMDTLDLWNFAQTPQSSLDRFQNCAFLSMMTNKSVTNWISYSRKYIRELCEQSNLDLICKAIFIAVIVCSQFSFLRISSCLRLINEQLVLIGQLGPVCSHGTSILLSLHVLLFVNFFRFSIIQCTFVIHQFHQLLFGYVTFHILVYIFSSVVSIVWYSFIYR